MPYAFDEFVFDESGHELRRAGVLLKADARVLELLGYLLSRPGQLVTKEELIEHVWQGRALGDNVISVCVAKLRKALGAPQKRAISSVYGRGYRFLLPVKPLGSVPSQPASPPPAVSKSRAGELPFVGRAAVIERLQASLERARGRRSGACALLGEAGIGKTRVAEGLAERAEQAGFRVSWGRCHALGDAPPLWPWLQVVRGCDAQLPSELRSHTLDEPKASASDKPHVAWEPQATGSWPRTLTWMSRVVAAITSAQPWLIVLEDMQWADAASLRLLAHLIVECVEQPILFVLTVRDTELPEDLHCRLALDYVLGHRSCERIVLPRLQAQDVGAFTAEIFGEPQSALTEAVFAQSDGNPFYMVELLRPFAFGRPPTPKELSLSEPALETLRRSLRKLDPAARQALGAAAVVGRSFDLGLLSAVTEVDAETLLERLEEPMDMHVIVPAPQSHTEFAFGHDLMRGVLYDDLSAMARVRLHQRVAEALAARPLSTAAARAELAHHLLSALPSADPARAIDQAQDAARAATRIGAYAEACGLLRRALDASRQQADENARQRCALLFELATNERAAGDPTFMEHFGQAVELARKQGFGEILAAAGEALSPAPGVVAVGRAFEVLDAARQLLPERELAARATVLAHLSWTPPSSWNAARAAELLAQAEPMARASGSATAMRAVLHAQLYYAGGPGDEERALSIASELERMAASRPDLEQGSWSLEAHVARIVGLLQRGQLAEARAAVEDFGRAAHGLHHAELIWHYDRMCAVMQMNAGEFAPARTALTALKERAERIQLHGRKTVEAIDWGELLQKTADIRPFAAQLSAGLRSEASDGPGVRAYKLRGLVQLGLLEEASAALAALPVQALYELPKSRDYLAVLSHLAAASAATHSLVHGKALYQLLQPHPKLYVASLSLHCHGAVTHVLGVLARSLGHHEEARAHFEQALIDHERVGLYPHLGRTRLELARVLLESGDARDARRARQLLAQAREDATRLTMEPLREAAQELLSHVTSSRYS